MDSTEHVGQMEKMMSMLEELQNTERARNQNLSERHNEASSLNRRVEKLEQCMNERFFSPLSQHKYCETVWVSLGKCAKKILRHYGFCL